MVSAALPAWMLIFLLLSGAPASMPLSLPPLPEDPVLTKVAPEQCVWYVSLAGVDKADPASNNKVEQLLAEDDVQHFMHDLSTQLQASFATAAPNNPLGKALAEEGPKLLGTLLTRPMVAYVGSIAAGPHGPTIRAGIAVNLGDNVAATKASLEKIEQLIPRPDASSDSSAATAPTDSGRRDFTPASPTALSPDAGDWHTLPTPPDAPAIQWGIKDKYLVIGIGEGEADLLWARTGKTPPTWLIEIKNQLKVDRPSIVQYVNLQTITNMAQMALAANQGPEQTRQLFEALGIQKIKYFASVGGLDQTGYAGHGFLAIEGQPTGLLALVGGQPLDAASLEPIPADASFALAARADVTKIIDAVLSIATVFEPQARQEFDHGLQQMSQMISINIKDDLLGSLGDTWCIYNSPGDGGLIITGLTITATIRDKAKLQHVSDQLVTLSKMLDQDRNQRQAMSPFGPRAAMPTLAQTEFRGQKIVFLNSANGDTFPFAPAWCVTENHVVIALFPQTIKSYLERQTGDSKSTATTSNSAIATSADQKKLTDIPEVAAIFSSGNAPTVFTYQDTPNQFKLFYPLLQIMTQLASTELQHQGLNLNVGLLPNSRAILPHLMPSLATMQIMKDGIRFDSHGTLPNGVGSLPLFATPLLLPAVFQARQAAGGAASSNNLKQIALAMLTFHDAKKSFPPAFSADKDSKPLLSWRVLILPFLGENDLFQKFKLDEPWDSPNNKPLIEKMPEVYKAPGSQAAADFKTVYLTVRGDNTAFPGAKGTRIKEFTDGLSKTIMVVEAADDKAAIWTKPDDFEVDEMNPLSGLIGLRNGDFLAAFCDGSIHHIPQSVDNDTLKALFTRNGGETVTVP